MLRDRLHLTTALIPWAAGKPQVDYFKSSLDAALLDTLWNKYWVNTLAASPLLATRPLGTGQLTDIGALFP